MKHTPDDCDECLKRVGQKNLRKVPFLYLDRNDENHPDLGNGYRQYYVCKECIRRYRK